MFYLVALEYAILASTFTIAKTALGFAKPFFLIGFRMTTAGILLLSYQYFFKKESFSIAKQDRAAFLKTALFHVYLAFMLEFWALQYLGSAKTAIIYSTTPFFAALLSYVLLKERLSFKKVAALCIGFCGLGPILLSQGSDAFVSGEFFSISLPEIVLLGSVISASYAWFIITPLMRKGYHLPFINGFAFLLGGTASLVTSFIVEGIDPLPIYNFWPFLGWTLLLVLMANIISYNFYGWLLRFYSITFMTFAGFLCPIFGSFFGWLFLNEAITWHHFTSLALVTIGLTLFYRDDLRAAR